MELCDDRIANSLAGIKLVLSIIPWHRKRIFCLVERKGAGKRGKGRKLITSFFLRVDREKDRSKEYASGNVLFMHLPDHARASRFNGLAPYMIAYPNFSFGLYTWVL